MPPATVAAQNAITFFSTSWTFHRSACAGCFRGKQLEFGTQAKWNSVRVHPVPRHTTRWSAVDQKFGTTTAWATDGRLNNDDLSFTLQGTQGFDLSLFP